MSELISDYMISSGNNQKRICILSFSNIARDGRVLRQIDYAHRTGFKVAVIGYGDWEPPVGVDYTPLTKSKSNYPLLVFEWVLLVLGRLFPSLWEKVFWRKKEYISARDLMVKQEFALIHANDWESLPVAGYVSKSNQVPLLYDAHEFTPAQESEKLQKRLLRKPYQEYLLRSYGVNISRMVTVSEGLKVLYEKNLNWKATVILNAPSYEGHTFNKVAPERINLIHHGGAIKGRNIEALIKLMTCLDERYHLYLMLVQGERKYYRKLRRYAAAVAPERITFMTPVSPGKIAAAINRFDVGIHLMRGDNLNHCFTLPNKLFEFIMAGLCVAVYPLPEMARFIQEYNLGIVSQEPTEESMAEALNGLKPLQIEACKLNSLSLAPKMNAQIEMEKLMEIYRQLLKPA